MTREERQKAAAQALKNPAVVEILKMLINDAAETWAATALPDAANREIAYFQMLGATMLREQLINWSRDTERKGDK